MFADILAFAVWAYMQRQLNPQAAINWWQHPPTVWVCNAAKP